MPEADRQEYGAAADKWVEEHDGYRFGAPEFNLYILYRGHVWVRPPREEGYRVPRPAQQGPEVAAHRSRSPVGGRARS